MQRDTIVYFGIIQHEYNNAMCQHAAGIEKMIIAIGYKAITIGVSPSVARNQYKKINETTYVVNDPQNSIDRIKECVFSSEIKKILKDIGTNKIKTFIMADFRYIPMKNMKRFCDHNGIYYAVDIMDRFVAADSLVSKIKKIDCDIRMKYFYPQIDRRIHICSYYNELLGTGSHTAVIPGVTWLVKRKKNKIVHDKIKIVFLGRPGLRCEKEKIDWVLKAVHEKKITNRFLIVLAGFDIEEFRDSNPELLNYFTENIKMLGRVSHNSCIHLLEDSDFSLVIRENTILSQYGFSTKIGEAFSCGIPVLATDTSDNSKYIKNGVNGYLCEATYEKVADMIEMVSNMNREQIDTLKSNVLTHNGLFYKNFINSFKRVIIDQ